MNDRDRLRRLRHWLWAGLGVVLLAGTALLGFMVWSALNEQWLHTGLAGIGLLLVLWRAEACLDALCRRMRDRATRKRGSPLR